MGEAKRKIKCNGCEGSGYVFLMNSCFVNDGYSRSRCGICGGSGENPPGYTPWPGDNAFRKKALARIKTWGGLKPMDGAEHLAEAAE